MVITNCIHDSKCVTIANCGKTCNCKAADLDAGFEKQRSKSKAASKMVFSNTAAVVYYIATGNYLSATYVAIVIFTHPKINHKFVNKRDKICKTTKPTSISQLTGRHCTENVYMQKHKDRKGAKHQTITKVEASNTR